MTGSNVIIHQRARTLEKHNMLVQEYKRLAQLAGAPAKDHHLGVFASLNSGIKPDLLIRHLGSGGNDLLIDFCICDPRGTSYVSHSAVKMGYARNKNESKKNNKYRRLSNQLGYSFLGASVEIFGSMTEKLQDLIKALVQRAAERSMIPYSTLLGYWNKRLSMTIQRGNAKLWLDSSVRMTGSNVLHDASLQSETHHIRTITA